MFYISLLTKYINSNALLCLFNENNVFQLLQNLIPSFRAISFRINGWNMVTKVLFSIQFSTSKDFDLTKKECLNLKKKTMTMYTITRITCKNM